jgi:hypothetical protein
VLLALAGCGDADTYYPVITCRNGCAERTVPPDQGYLRRRITVPPVQYTALVGRQDVIRQVQDLGPESLTRLGWMCTVRSQRDWECLGTGPHDRIAMVHGHPIDTTINDDEYETAFVPYCMWKQVEWHNATVFAPDALPWNPATERDDVAGLLGCDLALRLPLDGLITGRPPTPTDVSTPKSAAATPTTAAPASEPVDADWDAIRRELAKRDSGQEPDWDAVRRALHIIPVEKWLAH